MHKTRYNALRLALEITPRGPLLIKAGGLSTNPSLPDMQFVRTVSAGVGETLYLPGSSIKGVLRGFVEKVLRTVDEPDGWRWACPTFPTDERSCANRLQDEQDSATVYRRSCGACRIFGHTRLRGRLACSDFFPSEAVITEVRHGVAISRLSHAVAQGPFEMEVAVAGAFQGRVVLENYELWQLGLLCLALEALNHGLLKVGFGKNRGFGQVQVKVNEALVEEAGARQPVLRGLGAFVTGEVGDRYGLAVPNDLAGLPEPVDEEDLGFYARRRFDAEGWATVSRKSIEALQS